MSSILSSHGVVVATAAMAVSGTVILLALRRQKYHFAFNPTISPIPRPCISSGGENGQATKKKKQQQQQKKKVKFAEDVVGNGHGDGGVDVGKLKVKGSARNCGGDVRNRDRRSASSQSAKLRSGAAGHGLEIRGMPANRVALYRGILRDRSVHRFACAN